MDKDKNESDSDSSTSSGPGSHTNSGFRWMEGRRYAEGTLYIMPTDDAETDRLNMQHNIWKSVFEGLLYLAPIKAQLEQGCRVLDIGCGPGSWLLEMAVTYPKSQFVGLDIVKSIPDSSMLTNVTFIQRNINGLPDLEDNSFDFVFQRLMGVSYSREQWPVVMKELYRICKPGGYVELSESDWKVHKSGPQNHNINKRIMSALSARGLYPRAAIKLDSFIKKVNFEEVESTYRSVPFGWGGDVGMLVGENFRQGVEASKGWLAPVFDVSQEEFVAMGERCLQECGDMKQCFLNHCKAWGRKPLGPVV